MGELPKFTIALYDNEEDIEPDVREFDWDEIVSILTEHERTACDPCPGGKKCRAKCGKAWSPGVPREGETRCNDSIEFVSLLALDFDHLTPEEFDAVDDRLEGLKAVLHSSHSHRHGVDADPEKFALAISPEDDICVRIVFPLTRRLTPDEYRVFRRAFIDKYKLEWFRPLKEGQKKPQRAGADPTRKDLSGLYFLPSAPVGAPEVLAAEQDGALIDIEEMLKTGPKGVSRTVTRAMDHLAIPPVPAPSGPVDMEAIRKALRGYNPRSRPDDQNEVISRKDLVGRVARDEAMVKPEETGQRDHSCNRLGFILGRNFSDIIATEATLRFLVDMPVRKMPRYPDDDPEKDSIESRFDKVVRGWKNGAAAHVAQMEERAARKAERAQASQAFRSKLLNRKKARALLGDAPVEAGEDESEIEPTDEHTNWEDYLVRGAADDGEEGGLIKGEANVETVLRHSPEWRGVIRFNKVTKKVLVDGGPLEDFEMDENGVTSGIHYWFQRSTEWRMFMKKHEIFGAIAHTARANAFDPLAEYLNSLVWDGVNRIDTFLEVYCGAELKDPAGNDITEHTRRIGRRWLISAVARALDPGCKVDTILMLEGGQGIKKSTFIRALAGNDEWFTDSPISIADKDGKMLAAKKWIVELAELSALRASDVEAQKAFFSTRYDEFRPPYAHGMESFPRRCVYVGSTNDDKYLLDPTGNRRSWVARCKAFKIAKVTKDRDQLWAQAVAVYKAGLTCPKCASAAANIESVTEDIRCVEHRWWLSMKENEVSEATNNQRLRSGYSDIIRSWVLSWPIEERPQEVTTHMVAHDALGLSADKMEGQNRAIGLALKSLGFERKQRRVPGGSEYYYPTPEPLRCAPQRVKGKATGNVYVVPDEKKAKKG